MDPLAYPLTSRTSMSPQISPWGLVSKNSSNRPLATQSSQSSQPIQPPYSHNSASTSHNTHIPIALPGPSEERKGKWCSYCKKKGHMKDECWKLHGRPPRRPQGHIANQVPSQSDSVSVNKTELQFLRQMMRNQHLNPSSPGTQMAQTGNSITTLNTTHSPNDKWIVDSGATHHMAGNSALFTSINPCREDALVKIANGGHARIKGTGTVRLSANLTLRNVLFVPALTFNLLSVSQLTKEGTCEVTFNKNCCLFQDLTLGTTIGDAKAWDGLYYFTAHKPDKRQDTKKALVSSSSTDILLWHCRSGHPSFDYMKHVFPALFTKDSIPFQCETCHYAKHSRAPYPKQPYRPSSPFHLVHSDIWGPARIPHRTNHRWFVTFIDDHTRLTWVYLMKDKSDLPSIFQRFHALVQNQFKASIKILRSDNGREYLSHNLQHFLSQNGIHHQTSCPYTPQQNGVAERKNRHLLEVARALLLERRVPTSFWGDAILTAAFLINRMPSKVLNFETPYQAILKTYPTSRTLLNPLPPKVFGCIVFVHSVEGSKLDPRSLKCIFLGYSPTQKGYICYHPPTKRLLISVNTVFHENESYFPTLPIQGESTTEIVEWLTSAPNSDTPDTSDVSDTQLPNSDTPDTSDISDTQLPAPPIPDQNNSGTHVEIRTGMDRTTETEDEAEHPIQMTSSPVSPTPQQNQESEPMIDLEQTGWPIALRKGVRTKHPIQRFVSYNNLSTQMQCFVANSAQIQIPKNFKQAMTDTKWKHAANDELSALKENGTWDIVPRPPITKLVGCKWIFTPKFNPDGSINKYKARLVAKGFTQTHGIDYQETFAPVVKFNTIQVLLSIAANLDWSLHQLDVKNAFLNGNLEEEVYMEVPEGVQAPSGSACKLRKALYGLKQSPRAWFSRFNTAIRNLGYRQGQADDTLFVKYHEGKTTVLIVYVDDIIITGNDEASIEKLKRDLSTEFQVKDLGQMRYFLGMEVARSKEGINVSQRKYTLDLLQETGMMGTKPESTPMDEGCHLVIQKEGTPVDSERYRRLVGKLIYLTHTRPDISYAVGVVSQFMHTPQEEHLSAVYRILRYLKLNPGRGIFFRKSSTRSLQVFTDADHARDRETRRSTTGYCTYVWGNLVTWRSKKQNVVSTSSAEAELRAVNDGTREGLWIIRLLKELGISYEGPMQVWCDNTACIEMTRNPVYHHRTKHVDIDRHFIKERVEAGIMNLDYIRSTDQIADVLTKPLGRSKFEEFRGKLGMIDIYSPA